MALHSELGLTCPPPPVQSRVAGARRSIPAGTTVEEHFPASYVIDDSPIGHLRFALRHEPLDLRVVHAALVAIGSRRLEDWVRAEPTGAYCRRAWFLYEALTGRTLDVDSARVGNYVDALDVRHHYVAAPVNSPRHRVRDNLLGTRDLCVVVRRTPKLEAMVATDLSTRARTLVSSYPIGTVARAISFLYTKETRSSFAIEGETPTRLREARFRHALEDWRAFDPLNSDSLVRLQTAIVDPRYAAHDWRGVQVYVGETTRDMGEFVHFVCPRAEDVPSLMRGWSALTARVLGSPIDPVVSAAVSAFAFVFIHPFEDGNGRIHRFLVHYVLSSKGFGPADVVFPVSAAILRRRRVYDEALEAFSRPVMACIDWTFTTNNAVRVRGETMDLYRFIDATSQTEYLFDRVTETIADDLGGELDFLEAFDAALRAVMDVVDMPDRRASLLARLCLSNGGRLSASKRRLFAELTDGELAAIEARMIEVVAASSR